MSSEPPITLTIAALYAGQGYAGKAREMYRRLSQEGPPEQRAEAAARLARMGPDAGAAIRLLEGLRGQAPGRQGSTSASGQGSAEAAMSFREDLEGICGRVTGTFAASVMGFDGIPIETVEPKPGDGVEVQTMLVEYSGILSQLRQAAEALQMGKASEVSIRTERMVAVARMLTADYFAVIAMDPDGNVGRARYELRVQGPKMADQLV
jgi:predicted regulator of Ras-like GTPase activity (Roadblock/LC7/MglB family)